MANLLLRVRKKYREDKSVLTEEVVELPYIRIQPSSKSRQNGQGNQFFANWKIFLDPEVDLLTTDIVRYAGKDYAILEMYPVSDNDGDIHHIQVRI